MVGGEEGPGRGFGCRVSGEKEDRSEKSEEKPQAPAGVAPRLVDAALQIHMAVSGGTKGLTRRKAES